MRRLLGRQSSFRYPLPRWVAGRDLQRAGSRNSKILCLGDSTTLGNLLVRTSSYPNLLAPLIPGGNIDNVCGNGNVFATWATYDPRMTIGANWAASVACLGGLLSLNVTNANNISFAPAGAFDTAEIWYPVTATGGAVDVDIDGGAATNISLNGTANYTKTNITGSLATHTINYRRSSGNAFFQGIICYNSAVKSCLIVNAGRSAGLIADTVVNTQPYNDRAAIAIQAPDLTILSLTINDWNAPTAAATYRSNTQLVIDSAKAVSDVILIAGPPSDAASFASVQGQRIYRDIYRDLAESNGLNLIDLSLEWGGTFAQANARGYMADARHPNLAGNNAWVRILADYLNGHP